MSKVFLYRNVLVTASNFLVGALNWAFLFLVLKFTNVNEANTFLAFVSIFLLLSIPSTTINYVTNKIGRNLIDWIKSNMVRSIFIIIIYMCVCIGASLLYGFSLLFSVYLSVLIVLALISSYNKAILQHNLQFVKFASISIIEVLAKILFLYFTINYLHNSAWFAMGIQYLISAILPILANIYLNPKKNISPNPLNFQTLATATAFSASIVIFTNIDTLIGKNILNNFDFNQYQKILQLAKVLLFFSTGLNLVLMPSILSEKDPKNIFKMFGFTFLAEITFSVIFIIIVSLFTDKIFSVFSIPLLQVIPVMITLFSMVIYGFAQSISFVFFRQNAWKIILGITFILSSVQIVGYLLQRDLLGFTIMNLVSSISLLFLFAIFSIKYLRNYFKSYYLQ